MGIYNDCCDIYNTDLTPNDLTNVPYRKGSQPFGSYNSLGELDGYYWHYGDSVNLSFNIDGELSVESDAIIYTAIGDAPTTETIGRIDQRAYNVVDLKSWTCVAIDGSSYSWEQDATFTYPEDGARTLFVTASEYLKGKKAKVCLFNFRYEKVFEVELSAAPIINVSFDIEQSKKFERGSYYLTLQIIDDISLLYIPVIKGKECVIEVR